MNNVLFYKKQVPRRELFLDVGRRPERPFMIYAPTVVTTLGDLIAKIVFFCTLKNQFDHGGLHVVFRDARPYSREVISLAPNIDQAEVMKGDGPAWKRAWLPRSWFRSSLWPGIRKSDPLYDFVVTEWMADARNLNGLPDPVPLRIPPDRAPSLERRLIELGLDPERWFVALHYRHSSYEWRKGGQDRDSDPDVFRKLVNYVIDELGGQVVRLGHPELHLFPERRGFVDLSRISDSFLLQACAVSRARFMIAGPSGGVAIAWGMQTPVALVDDVDGIGGWGDMERVILTHEVTTPDGRCLRNRDLLEAGYLCRAILSEETKSCDGYSVRKCTDIELARVADHMLARTANTIAWRSPKAMPTTNPKPNSFVWPPQTNDNLRFIDV